MASGTSEVRHWVRRARDDIHTSLRALVLYDLFLKVVVGLVGAPVVAWLLGRLIGSTGNLAVGNSDILAFVMSPLGLMWLLLVGASTLAVVGLEQGGMMYIMRAAERGVQVRPIDALWALCLRARILMKLGAVQIGFHALFSAPILAIAGIYYAMFLAQYDLNFLTSTKPPAFWYAAAVAAVLITLLAIANASLYIRWALALPAVLFGDDAPREALRISRARIRSMPFKRTLTVLEATALIFILPAVAAFLLKFVPDVLTPLSADNVRVLAVLMGVFMFAYAAALFVATFYGIALSAALVNCIYAETDPDQQANVVPPPAAPRSFRTTLILATAALALIAAGTGIAALVSIDLSDRTLNTAHRGSSAVAPENTMSAILQAIEDGADYAEIDVQETADGHLVVIHDEDFMRLTGDPRKVYDLTLAEYEGIDAGTWFSDSFAGEPVPSLDAVIEACRNKIKLNIELKVTSGESQLAERVVALLHEKDFVEQSVVTSLDFNSLQRVRAVDPDIQVGFIIFQTLGNPERLEVDFFSMGTRFARRDVVVACQNAGKEVHVWTINDRATMGRFIDLGVDNIITDYPADLAEVLHERQSLSDAERLLLKIKAYIQG
jgi:glycerophosphoryl diester phosphodiesterase